MNRLLLFVLFISGSVFAEDRPRPQSYDCANAMVALQAARDASGLYNLGTIICSEESPSSGETLNCPWVRFSSDNLTRENGAVWLEACTPTPTDCPENSTLSESGTFCTCPDSRQWSESEPYTCDLPPDPCDSLTVECAVSCGGYENVVSPACQSLDGVLSAPYSCLCADDEPDPEDLTDDPCDVVGGGIGCATSDMQDKQKAAMDEIKARIDAGNLTLTGINGILQNSDGTFTDIKTLLTQIANSPGILGTGGTGTGGTGTGGTGEGEGEDDTGWTPPTGTGNGFATRTAQIDAEITTKKAELMTTVRGIKTGIIEKLAVDSTPSGVGGLPCWRNLPLVGSQHFDLCFSDFEDELAMIPMFIYAASILLAALIILRPRGGDN